MRKKIEFDKLSAIIAEELFSSIQNNIMDLSEYQNFEREDLIKYNINRVSQLLEIKNSISFSLRINGIARGFILLTKDLFDSKIYDMNVYKFNYLILKSDDINEIADLLKMILLEIDRLLYNEGKNYYILYSLNCNFQQSPLFLTQLQKNGYYYIQTLLTFGMTKFDFKEIGLEKNDSITVRNFRESDLDAICTLAKKSFNLSRFYLDKNLDSKKSNILLETSARNSILNGYADVIFVAEHSNNVVGYYSAKKRIIQELGTIIGEAIISAVDENYRGLGIFKQLNYNILEWFYRNTDFAEMGTYLVNHPVHRTWIQYKLKLVRGVHQIAKFVKINGKK